jgi:capsular exopolysaccharide synthesis family protein
VKTMYGPNHPEYRKAASELSELQKQFEDTTKNIAERVQVQYKESMNREQMLAAAVAQTKAEWDSTNARWFEYDRLKQEADTDRALYDELIKKIREADINAGFQTNNIRIADAARPAANPVFPNIKMDLLLAFIFSLVLAVGTAILLDSLDTTLRDPKEASRFLGTEIVGVVPIDRSTAALPIGSGPLVSAADLARSPQPASRKGYYPSASNFEEAVRSLRNTILLSDFEGRLRSIVLTSATPSEGKTTLAVHLAIASAAHGKKTLLVDGDLRRPSVHAKFGLTPHEGLANVLTGEMAWQDVVLTMEGQPNMFVLPAGLGSHRAADLMGGRLSPLLDEFNKEYDFVILDSPPLLGFAECLQMASAADGVLIVSRAGETKRRAVAEVISVLRRLRANIIGVVLNRVSESTSSQGYGYYSYYKYGKYGYGYGDRPAGE